MNKLMITVAVAACAAIAQAATITWGSGTIYYASEEGGSVVAESSYKAKGASSGHQVKAYLYTFATEELYNAAKGKTVKELYETYVTGAKSTAGTAETKTAGTANIAVSAADGTAENPQTMYGLVIYEDTNTPKTDGYENIVAFVKAAFDAPTWQDTSGASLANLAGTGSWTAVESVPEPFSGTLALLGMGAIALRRKMKKAKKA